jgi:hypothetical protein
MAVSYWQLPRCSRFVGLGSAACSSPPAISADSATGWALRLIRFVHGTVEQ